MDDGKVIPSHSRREDKASHRLRYLHVGGEFVSARIVGQINGEDNRDLGIAGPDHCRLKLAVEPRHFCFSPRTDFRRREQCKKCVQLCGRLPLIGRVVEMRIDFVADLFVTVIGIRMLSGQRHETVFKSVLPLHTANGPGLFAENLSVIVRPLLRCVVEPVDTVDHADSKDLDLVPAGKTIRRLPQEIPKIRSERIAVEFEQRIKVASSRGEEKGAVIVDWPVEIQTGLRGRERRFRAEPVAATVAHSYREDGREFIAVGHAESPAGKERVLDKIEVEEGCGASSRLLEPILSLFVCGYTVGCQ